MTHSLMYDSLSEKRGFFSIKFGTALNAAREKLFCQTPTVKAKNYDKDFPQFC